MEAFLIFAGFVVGVTVWAKAIGAGIFTVPLLILLGIRPMEAVGTALAVNFVTRLMAAWWHNRQKTINYGWVLSRYREHTSVHRDDCVDENCQSPSERGNP